MQIRIQVLLIALATVLASAHCEAHAVLSNQFSAAGVMFAQVGNTVPEPATVALLALSGAVAGVAYLRKRNK